MEPHAGLSADEGGARSPGAPFGDSAAADAPRNGEVGPVGEVGEDDEVGQQSFESRAVASFLQRRETSARREARDRARAKRLKAVEEEAIASWLHARKTS